MSDQGKPTVPKFASFKPAARKRAVGPEAHTSAQPKVKRSRSSVSPPAEPSRHRTRPESAPGARHESRHASRPESRPRHHRQHDTEQDHADLYTVDTRGDVQNLTYQRLHKYAIPQYRRTGFGHVLGVGSRFKIDKDASVEDKIYLVDANEKQTAARRERALLKKPKRTRLRHLRIAAASMSQPASFDPAHDFVPLPFGLGRPGASAASPPPDAYDQVRALHDIDPVRHAPADLDLVYAESDDERDSDELDAEARQQNAELSRMTKANPSHLQAWLDLVSHQDRLVRPAALAAVAHDFTATERRTLADLRLHIFEKATKSIPVQDKPSRETLFERMFQEAAVIWESQKYLDSLHDALRELPSSFALWKLYLDAVQTNPSAFKFENVKAFFLKALGSMHAAHSPEMSTTTGAADMYLYVILRYTTFLREAGYEELSLAIWQAIFEFHLFRPALTGIATSDIMAAFESFWESETPRFAESGALGWRGHGSEDGAPDESVTGLADPALSPSHPFKSFVDAEDMASASMRFPGRTNEDTPSEDPFHIVFFSDLKEMLELTPFLLPHPSLTDAFLCYLGLPLTPAPASCVRAQAWKADSFISGGLLGDIASSHCSSTRKKSQYQNSPYTLQHLFSGLFPDKSVLSTEISRSGTLASLDAILNCARNSLEALVREYSEDEALAEYYLAFLCNYHPEAASKAARTTLKKRQTSLRLYNACAMVEATLGRSEKAAHIWAGALKMKDSFPMQVQPEAVLSWQHWTWNDMQQGQLPRALSRLVSFDGSLTNEPDTVSYSSSATLRVKNSFKEGLAHALSHSNARLFSSNVECLALLAYLSLSDGLVAAMAVIEENCALVQGATAHALNKTGLELLHLSKASIISYHVQQQRPYKPASLRSQLEASIRLFPDNSTFLWLYQENEARFRIDDRVRAILKDNATTGRRSALVRFSFEVDQEMSRYDRQASGSTTESVRATFHRALLASDSQIKHSKSLWSRWLRFEEAIVQRHLSENPRLDKRHCQQALQKWKDVFLGGLHHLPWVKEWILYGLRAFDSEHKYGWNMRELKRLYNVLHERELRVRVEGLEDLLDDIEEGVHASKH